MSASRQGRFPLKDCIGKATDLLALLDYDIDQSWKQQLMLMRYVNGELFSLKAQWLQANVVDQFSVLDETIDASEWSFHELRNDRDPYMMQDTETLETPTTDLRTRLELKIYIVKRLFVEMNGTRNNSIRVAVVFLEGKKLSLDDIRNVPSIVQQLNSVVKIFTVIFGSQLVNEIVHLTDTLVLPNMQISNFDQYLLMAMCKRCGKGWVVFEHKTGLSMLSCVKIYTPNYYYTWTRAMSECNAYHNGYLLEFESEEQMLFLKEQLFLNMIINDVNFFIGLHRNVSSYAKRFQWVTNQGLHRPLLFQHWLPGQPCRECIDADCVVWQFTSYSIIHTYTERPFSAKTPTGYWRLVYGRDYYGVTDYIQSEGWRNVNCDSEIVSAKVCQVVLPQRNNDTKFIFSVPAPTKDSMSIIEKKHFRIYEKNIVSVSANVQNPKFLKFLENTSLTFPIFDCGEDAGDRRYISYSLVCDFIDHCSNRRDERHCVNTHIISQNESYCVSGQRLHSEGYKCDNVKDCRDGSDEKNCIRKDCKSVRCQDGSCLPLQWVNDGEFDCFAYTESFSECILTDESPNVNLTLLNHKSCMLSCSRDTCIEESHLNESEIECKGPERHVAKTLRNLQPANTCNNSFEHFIWAPKCHYIKDRHGGIVGCRDMSHLRHCGEFQCSQGYVKCYNSYCIHHHYLRDGQADCPTGEDEQLFYTGPCTGHFACWDSIICLDPDLVCDGHPDCPYEDDELDCQVPCPKGFRCIAGTMTVSDYNKSAPLNMNRWGGLNGLSPRIRYLDMSKVNMHQFNSFIKNNTQLFYNLKVLILSKCNLSKLYLPAYDDLEKKDKSFTIQKLDISYNKFQIFSNHMYNNYFKHLNYLNISYNKHLTLIRNLRFGFLEILDLSYTSVSYLNNSVFANLPKLKHLNLSHTLISDFTRQYFSTKMTLHSLDLRGIRTKDLDDFLFHGITISQALFTDHFHICCPQIQGLVISPRDCFAPVDVDAISSCSNLLGLDIQRFLLWIVAILAILGNVTVIVYRVIWDMSVLQTGYGLFVTNLGISDFIMGVYLFMIAGADSFYRDTYVLYDKSWRNSVVCKIAGFMACLSCEASTFFIFLITLDRFLVMKFPFGQIKFTGVYKTIAVVMSWVVSFLLSLVPIMFNFDIYSSNAMCLGLPLTNTHANGWEYSVGVFIISNMVIFLFTACGQYAIFRAMSENSISKTSTTMSSSRRAKEITVAKQLSLVVLSDFLFWFPVGIMGLMSLGGYEVSSVVYSWTTVLLLPINSAANPVLYTIPALLEKWEEFKLGGQRRN